MKYNTDLSNSGFIPCKECSTVPEVFINTSYYDMITCRCNCATEKDYPTAKIAEETWNNLNGDVH